MIQFILMNAQAIYLIYHGCNQYPRNITIAYGYYILSLLVLFANFFVMSYIVGGRGKSGGKNKGGGAKGKKDASGDVNTKEE